MNFPISHSYYGIFSINDNCGSQVNIVQKVRTDNRPLPITLAA